MKEKTFGEIVMEAIKAVAFPTIENVPQKLIENIEQSRREAAGHEDRHSGQ